MYNRSIYSPNEQVDNGCIVFLDSTNNSASYTIIKNYWHHHSSHYFTVQETFWLLQGTLWALSDERGVDVLRSRRSKLDPFRVEYPHGDLWYALYTERADNADRAPNSGIHADVALIRRDTPGGEDREVLITYGQPPLDHQNLYTAAAKALRRVLVQMKSAVVDKNRVFYSDESKHNVQIVIASWPIGQTKRITWEDLSWFVINVLIQMKSTKTYVEARAELRRNGQTLAVAEFTNCGTTSRSSNDPDVESE